MSTPVTRATVAKLFATGLGSESKQHMLALMTWAVIQQEQSLSDKVVMLAVHGRVLICSFRGILIEDDCQCIRDIWKSITENNSHGVHFIGLDCLDKEVSDV